MKKVITFNTNELLEIARLKNSFFWIIPAWIVTNLLSHSTSIGVFALMGWVFTQVYAFINCIELARRLEKNVLLWKFLTAVPLVNLFAYVRLYLEANKVLKTHGVTTGIFGASKTSMDKRATGSQSEPEKLKTRNYYELPKM